MYYREDFCHDHFDQSPNEMELSMFNGNFRHPLDNLIRDDRLFIMEAIIPFVDDNMKAPLAMYIKFMELKAILEALRDPGYVNSCGLHKDINNQDDIFSSLANCGLMGGKEQLENMKKAMNVMNMMNSMKQDGDTEPGMAGSGMADSGTTGSGMTDSSMAGSRMADSGMTDSGTAGSGMADSRMADSGMPDFDTTGVHKTAPNLQSSFTPDYNYGYYDTDQLYQHYNAESHTEKHQEKDLFGSIKDLFDEYDRNH